MGDYSTGSLDNLSKEYKLLKLRIEGSDRCSFIEVTSVVVEYLRALRATDGPVLLLGELFGLLVTYSSIRARDSISGLVVVNPATSYDKTAWSTIGPLVAASPYQQSCVSGGAAGRALFH